MTNDGYAMIDDAAPPDDGGAAVVSTSAGDQLYAPVSDAYAPPAVTAELAELLTESQQAVTDLQGVCHGLSCGIGDDLAAATADVRTCIDGVCGGLDNAMDVVEPAVGKVTDKVAGAVDVSLNTAFDRLRVAGGINLLPTNLMAAANEADPADWLPAVIPGLMDTVRVQAESDAVGATAPDDTGMGGTGGDTVTSSTGGDLIYCTDTAGEKVACDTISTDVPEGCTIVAPVIPGHPPVMSCPQSPPPAPPPPEPPWPPPDSCPATCPVVSVGMYTTDACGNTTAFPGGGMPEPPVGSPIGAGGGGPFGPPPPPVPPGPTLVPPPPPVGNRPDTMLPEMSTSSACLDWDTLDACDHVGFTGPTAPPETSGGTGYGSDQANKGWLDRWIQQGSGYLSMVIPGYTAVELGHRMPIGHDASARWAMMHDVASKITKDVVGSLTGACVENTSGLLKSVAQIGAARWAEKQSGVPLSYLVTSAVYALQYSAPQYLPGQGDLDNMFLRDKINEESWECLTKANGNLPQWHRAARQAKQATMTSTDITQLYRRGKIGPGVYVERMKELGFTNEGYIEDTYTLSELPLSPGDIVRCMTRDSFDEAVVKKFDYDKDFGQKFSGQAEDWFRWQGYSAEQAKYLWRAHWEIPSNTALYEMLHRLRPDRQSVTDFQAEQMAANAAGRPGPEGDGPPVVEAGDVKEAMEVNDVAPAWVDRLMAISYRPITNTDASRMYEVGFVEKPEMVDRFRDNGYTKEDAQKLGDFYEFERNKMVSNSTGVLSARKLVRLYKSGAIDRTTFTTKMADLLPDQELRDKLTSNVDTEIEAETKQATVSATHSKYMVYELSEQDARGRLGAAGIAGAMIPHLVAQWVAERSGKSREVQARVLCQFRSHGLIDAQVHVDRLQNLGYSLADAQRIARVCEVDSGKAAQKEARTAMQQQKQDLAAKVKELQQQLAAVERQIQDRIAELYGMGGTVP